MPINILWNSYFLGVYWEEFEAFTTGIYIAPDRNPESYAQETAVGDNEGS